MHKRRPNSLAEYANQSTSSDGRFRTKVTEKKSYADWDHAVIKMPATNGTWTSTDSPLKHKSYGIQCIQPSLRCTPPGHHHPPPTIPVHSPGIRTASQEQENRMEIWSDSFNLHDASKMLSLMKLTVKPLQLIPPTDPIQSLVVAHDHVAKPC